MNLLAGSYNLTLRSADESCSLQVADPLILGQPAALLATGTSPPSTGNDGTAMAHATGGTPPYLYALNGGPFQTDSLFQNLPSGNQQIEVVDANGCTFTVSVVVEQMVGIEEGLGGWLVYPNPAGNTLRVSLSDLPAGRAGLELRDVRGVLVRKMELEQCETVFSVVDLPRGIYHLKIQQEGMVSHMKIVLQ